MVRLLQCGGDYGEGDYNTPINQELVPFEEYAAGVAYAEVGPGANIEVLKAKVKEAVAFDNEHPVLVDKYISGQECEVDAVCDGENVFIPGIMEHIERTGVHSGDSMSVYPPYSLSDKVKNIIVDYTTRIGIKLQMIGLFNIQFIVDKDNKVYIIERKLF